MARKINTPADSVQHVEVKTLFVDAVQHVEPKEPSLKRQACAWAAAITGAFGTGYLAGMAIEAILLGAIALGVPGFILWVIYILGFIASMKLGATVAPMLYNFVTGKGYAKAYNSVVSYFRPMQPSGVAA
jgi:hypothetical protein